LFKQNEFQFFGNLLKDWSKWRVCSVK
jgi:hypothetical protein